MIKRKKFYLAVFLFTSTLHHGSLSRVSAEPTYAIAKHGDVKYPRGFHHFEGVNPNAPKGGEYKGGVVGTFDSLNPFTLKGTSPAGIRDILFESLMRRNMEEPFTMYPLVAESLEVAPDRSWIIFYINPQAKWQDGVPLTAKDVLFSFKTFLEHGTPNQQMTYKKVKSAESLGNLTVKFTFFPTEAGTYDSELPLLMGGMALLAEHDLKGKDFEKTGLRPLLGSGPYKVAHVESGRSIVYAKNPHYWGADLPVNRGHFNFDTMRFDFYKNATVAFEAFKAGNTDSKEESDLGKWSNNYNFPAVQDGRVQRIEIPHKHQVGMTGVAFNTRRELFKDPRVRRALAYGFDFDNWNKTLYNGQLVRTTSFFDNTDLAAKGLPTGTELALLDPFRAQLPKEVFEEPYTLPTFKGGGRENLKKARTLLKEAGWVTKNGKLVNAKTGKPFVFELILNVPENEKAALALQRNLKLLGIGVTVRTVDAAQYENLRTHMNFDAIINMWGHTMSPGNEQSFYWSSKAADEPGTRNYPGIKSPVVDKLCEAVDQAKTREELIAALRALDRVLLWGHYILPLGHRTKDCVACWKRLGYPPLGKVSTLGIPSIHTFWSKEEH